MKEVTESDVLNNFNFWRRAVAICTFSKTVTTNQIAYKLGDSKSNSYFYSLMRFLEDNNFLTIDKSRVPHLISIKSSKLAWFLREGDIFNLSKNLISVSMGVKPHYYG